MIDLISGMIVTKNERLKKQKQTKNSYPSPGIHQDGRIGACQKNVRKRQKNGGHKHGNFCVWCPDTRNFVDQKEILMKMSSLLNVSNPSSKPQEFSIKDIEVLVDNELV